MAGALRVANVKEDFDARDHLAESRLDDTHLVCGQSQINV